MSVGRTGPFLEPCAVLSRRRCLPMPGEVLLEIGDRVLGDTVVSRAPGRGELHAVNAVRALDILPAELPAALVVKVGDRVEAGAPLARTRGLWGLFRAVCRAPVAGTVAAVSAHTGRVLLEEPAMAHEVRAFLPGVVTAVEPGRGVTVAGWAARAAGVFGVGDERSGPLLPVVGRPDATLDAAQIGSDVAGCVLLGGAVVTADALTRAAALGAHGVITGGIRDVDLASWLGCETVLADTTGLSPPLTLVVIGGFGRVPMDAETFALLHRFAGRRACVVGRTRVRASAERPEVIVPLSPEPETTPSPPAPASTLRVGSRVLVVSRPWFGLHGRVGRLPAEPCRIETGARCLVAEVDLANGRTVRVPRANLEILADPEREVGP